MHLGHLHVLIVHFPIGLALGAAVADLLWLITRRSLFGQASLYCLVAAVLVTPAVLLTGDMLSDELFPADTNAKLAALVEQHEDMAFVSFGLMVAAAAVRVIWIKRPAPWAPVAYGLLMLGLFVCIGITGHLGGKIVYGSDWLAKLFG
jgi:uncharacterized membrane protein